MATCCVSDAPRANVCLFFFEKGKTHKVGRQHCYFYQRQPMTGAHVGLQTHTHTHTHSYTAHVTLQAPSWPDHCSSPQITANPTASCRPPSLYLFLPRTFGPTHTHTHTHTPITQPAVSYSKINCPVSYLRCIFQTRVSADKCHHCWNNLLVHETWDVRGKKKEISQSPRRDHQIQRNQVCSKNEEADQQMSTLSKKMKPKQRSFSIHGQQENKSMFPACCESPWVFLSETILCLLVIYLMSFWFKANWDIAKDILDFLRFPCSFLLNDLELQNFR